jgi:putative FmdB family regulatory protein
MPTYEYRCKDCGEHLEIVQAFSDDPLTECPNCQGLLKKVFNSVGISFKGSGFYKTDSRSGASTSSSGAGSSAGSTSSESSSSSDSGSTSSTSSTSDGSSSSRSGDSGSSGSSKAEAKTA